VDQGPQHWGWAEMHGWQVLRPLLDAGGFLPWTEGAMSPAGLATVATEISLAERKIVVELGSGVSTVVLARLERELGGRVFALEHSPAWAGWVRRALARDGLEEVATVIDAPLGAHPLSLEGAPWYEEAALDSLPAEGIELLLVDGPPGYGDGMSRSRHPALPALQDRLAPGALVILDDAEREGEREILDAWERDLPWRFDRRPAERIAIGRRVTSP
jgi:predicted O-methyltransferase YrrM